MLQNKANAVFGLIVVAAATGLLHQTTYFEGEADDRLFPQIILVILMVLGVVLILSEVRFSRLPRPEPVAASAFTARKGLAFALAVGYPLVAFTVGFFTTTFLFLLLVPGWFSRSEALPGRAGGRYDGLAASVAYAALMTGFLYLSFVVLLKFSLPYGLLI